MDCNTVRLLYSDACHGRLVAAEAQEREAHLRDCAACREAEQSEQALTGLLRDELPAHSAPPSLKRELESAWLATPRPRPARTARRLGLALWPAVALTCAALAFGLGFASGKRHQVREPVVALEAVDDHLRMLEGEAPLQVAASDMHQVKPWFAGKLDFAPPVTFKGDDDYPLVGGAVVRFLGQRAACFVFARRLHKISLFVVSASGLAAERIAGMDWASSPTPSQALRGFAMIDWKRGEFAYLLVSDLNTTELLDLGNRIAAAN